MLKKLGLAGGVLLLAACDMTGPTRPPEITPGEAAPFTRVHVEGLPAAYHAGASVRVGADTMPLLMDDAAGLPTFMVPDHPAGDVQVVIRSGSRPDSVSLPLRVLASPVGQVVAEQASAEVVDELVSVANTLTLLEVRLESSGDTAIARVLGDLAGYAHQIGVAAAALGPEDRLQLGRFLAANDAEVETLLSTLSAMLGDLSHSRASFQGTSALAAGAESVEQIGQRCVSRDSYIERLNKASDSLEVIGWGVAFLSGPAAPVVAAIVGILSVLADLSAAAFNLDAFVPVPGSLELAAMPGVLRPGDSGAIGLSLFVTSPYQSAGLAKLPKDARELSGNLRQMRSKLAESRGNLKAIVKDVATDAVIWGVLKIADEVLKQYVPLDQDPAFKLGWPTQPGRVPVGARGVVIQANPASHYSVDATGSISEARFRVPGGVAEGMVKLLGSWHTPVTKCQISSSDTPTNQYEVRNDVGGRLTFSDFTDTLSVPQGRSRYGTAVVHNTGARELSGTKVFIGTIQDGKEVSWTPPAGIRVWGSNYAYSIAPDAKRSTRITVEATLAAPLRPFLMPVTAISAAQHVTRLMHVDIVSQLSDVVVNQQSSSIGFYDHGTQDGDIIRLELNGQVLHSALLLENRTRNVPVQYRQGVNVLKVTALNEGALKPNTAALLISDAVDGTNKQEYQMTEGSSVTLKIEYIPAYAGRVAQPRPAPTYSPEIELP